jgi:hypothetical protein
VKGMQHEIDTHTHTANASFENVAKFEYFGTINKEEIKFTEFLLLFRRIFCLPVCSIKAKRLQHTEL